MKHNDKELCPPNTCGACDIIRLIASAAEAEVPLDAMLKVIFSALSDYYDVTSTIMQVDEDDEDETLRVVH